MDFAVAASRTQKPILKHWLFALLLSTWMGPSLAQTIVTFDIQFERVYEASGAFTPNVTLIQPGPFNNNEPIPPPDLTGTITLSLADSATALAAPPEVNTITLNGSFTTESGFSPSNGWSIHSFDNAVFDFYAPGSFVALDSTSDPRDWPLITGTGADGLISDDGPAALYGGVCPTPGGCLSANAYALFEEGTLVFDVATGSQFPTYADAGNHALISGAATQTNPGSGLGFDNGMDALVIDAVLDQLNNSQPYGDGVDGNPGKVRIVTFSNTGNTTYIVEGRIIEVPVPVPAAVWLFASGLGLLGFVRRRLTRPVQQRSAPVSLLPVAAAVLLTGCFDGSTNPPPTNPDNQTPVANAGADQLAVELVPVSLDGSGSTDGDGDALTYEWEFTSVPAGSLAALDDPNVVDPEFTPDVIGDYVLQLTVDDGFANGIDSDTTTVTAEAAGTNPPVADAGPDQNVLYSPPGVTINLDGTGSSDPDGDPITYDWQITNFTSSTGLPLNNPVVLFGDDTATPFFDVNELEQLGEYTIELTVSDGVLQSSDTVIVTVEKGMPAANVLFGSSAFAIAGLAWFRRRHRQPR